MKIIIFILVSLHVVACGPKDYSKSHQQFVQEFRLEKDEFMSSEESPFKAPGTRAIQLDYYPIKAEFAVISQIKRIENGGKLTLGTSDGVPREYLKFAYAHFTLKNSPQKLLILKSTSEDGHLFLAYSDLTSDNTTYGGGRYIDVNFDQAKSITLDFNMSFNPYCEYNASYSCPLPPMENRLNIAIEAGEKIYTSHQ